MSTRVRRGQVSNQTTAIGSRGDVRAAALVVGLLYLLLPFDALAQARPDLDGIDAQRLAIEVEHERTRAAICAKVEADGDTYRPLACNPRCDCFGPHAVGSVSSCDELPSTQFNVSFAFTLGLCEGWCNPSLQTCQGSGVACTTDVDCVQPAVCDLSSRRPCGACLQGESCVDGVCVRECSVDVDCEVPASATLSPVVGADDPAVVTCNGGVPSPITINSNDALQCLDDMGALLGASCASLCGNGNIGPGEQCDDGNTTPGDGCDATCQIE